MTLEGNKLLFVGNKITNTKVPNIDEYDCIVGYNRLNNLQCVNYRLDYWFVCNCTAFYDVMEFNENLINSITNCKEIFILSNKDKNIFFKFYI